MDKLYRNSGNGTTDYWETWESIPGTLIVHWGELGTRGSSKTIGGAFLSPAQKKVEDEMREKISEGFEPILPEDHTVLIVEFAVQGMGTSDDLEKRHALEDRLNELLGWTGLGSCDGGSIGSGAMEVANFVVDYEIAERVISQDLVGTEFGDFSRIYAE